jgi:hypothetical protein
MCSSRACIYTCAKQKLNCPPIAATVHAVAKCMHCHSVRCQEPIFHSLLYFLTVLYMFLCYLCCVKCTAPTPRRRYLYFAVFSLQAGAHFPYVASPLIHQTCLTSSACAPAWASLPTSFYHGCPTYTNVCTHMKHTLVLWKQS